MQRLRFICVICFSSLLLVLHVEMLVVGQADIAMRTTGNVSALLAFDVRGISPPVLEKDYLLFAG